MHTTPIDLEPMQHRHYHGRPGVRSLAVNELRGPNPVDAGDDIHSAAGAQCHCGCCASTSHRDHGWDAREAIVNNAWSTAL